MRNNRDNQLEELSLDELELICGGMICYEQYVWADGPRLICDKGPWDGPTYNF
ncbi:hypothetical protein [Shewanella septentrionalis]|uniref:Uncharacterized protein n=1 Tax=Shewanella septentrionalis TaxID=2952223 RepID=A0A9X2WRX9_9GAMM|nr:hypothetical protein [Shewanella septentrionalis]MCT7944260.1 hypothetical protein [Shewanella septentrionalis]